MKTLIDNLSQVVTVDSRWHHPGNVLGVIDNGAIGFEDGVITWVGEQSQIPQDFLTEAKRVDGARQVAVPGLIDSHTHPVFGGDRADEFEQRLAGRTYIEIAAAGGGILKTMHATREASFESLKASTKKRLETSLSFGITTIEAKSGYGLTTESELKSLEVLKALQSELPMDIIPTFMGAHDIPPEYKGRTEEYVALVCEEMLPQVAERRLAEFCDVFCETGYFSVEQSRKILETAKALGLEPRIHAEEFTDIEGAVMASEIGAFSADHLLNLSDKGIQALAQSDTVATLLPGTAFYLRIKDYAPARKLRDAGATVAIATDFNPGSCYSQNLHLMMSLGCLQMGLLPHEVIQAVTINAAKAVGRHHDRGSLSTGKRADITLLALDNWHQWMYHYGVNPVASVWITGQEVYRTGVTTAEYSLQ